MRKLNFLHHEIRTPWWKQCWYNGIFSKLSGTFIEFSKFRESEESLKHELGSVWRSALLHVSLWSSGNISVSYTGDPGFHLHNPHFWFLIFMSLNSVKTFRENSIAWEQSSSYNPQITPIDNHGHWITWKRITTNEIIKCVRKMDSISTETLYLTFTLLKQYL